MICIRPKDRYSPSGEKFCPQFIGVAMGLSGLWATAATGAVIGGVAAGVTGGDVVQGALLGGVGGAAFGALSPAASAIAPNLDAAQTLAAGEMVSGGMSGDLAVAMANSGMSSAEALAGVSSLSAADQAAIVAAQNSGSGFQLSSLSQAGQQVLSSPSGSKLLGSLISGAASIVGGKNTADAATGAAQVNQAAVNAAVGNMATANVNAQSGQNKALATSNNLQQTALENAQTRQNTANQDAYLLQTKYLNSGLANEQPWLTSGQRALSAQNDLMGLGPNGSAGQITALESAPGYSFRKDLGNRNIEAGIAAKGGMGSGKSMTAGIEYNQNFASGEYGNRLAQLAGVSNTGLKTAGDMAQQGTNYANTQASQGINLANAQSSLGINYAQNTGNSILNTANNQASMDSTLAANSGNLMVGAGGANANALMAAATANQSGLTGAATAANNYFNPAPTNNNSSLLKALGYA